MANYDISNLLCAFFVNEYINKFRTKSFEYVEKKKFPDKLQAYRNIVFEYKKMVCGNGNLYGPIYYNKIMESFFVGAYKIHINSDDSFLTFIDRITLELLPQAHYNVLGKNYDKKQNILMGIIRKTIDEYTNYILSNVNIILGDKKSNEFVQNSKKAFNESLIKNSTTFINITSQNGNISVDGLLASLTEYKRNAISANKREEQLKQLLIKKNDELVQTKKKFNDLGIKYNSLLLEHNKRLLEHNKKNKPNIMTTQPKKVVISMPPTTINPLNPSSNLNKVSNNSSELLDEDDDDGDGDDDAIVECDEMNDIDE